MSPARLCFAATIALLLAALGADANPQRARTVRSATKKEAPRDGADAVSHTVTIRDIKAIRLSTGIRVTVELDAEVPYREARLSNPDRVFFDLRGAQPVASLKDATIKTNEDIVRHIRLGRHPNNTTRLVLDLDGVSRYSVFSLYSPYRLVIDCERAAPTRTVVASGVTRTSSAQAPSSVDSRSVRLQPDVADSRGVRLQPDLVGSDSRGVRLQPDLTGLLAPIVAHGRAKFPAAPILASPAHKKPPAATPSVSRTEAAPVRSPASDVPSPPVAKPEVPAEAPARVAARPLSPPPPAVPSANSGGGFSLARQLGLGVSRIVIDPGHGGHDPGAKGTSLTEASVVLDVALRLEKLLLKEPGVEVVMTRRTDEFIPLEERTEIANREGADLFLSIHANASRNASARGVETYYLNFASTPDAAVVAARENSASGRSMHSLPEIVRAITLNTKLDESRDLAAMVQHAMMNRLRGQNRQLRNLGVKQAPFVVLIGAGMPSVLAEVSFVTNKQEHQLLRSPAYRQRIAQALNEALIRYQKALKNVGTVAAGR